MSKHLLDTWAWIEYYEGSSVGSRVDQVISSENSCFTSIISLAELSDNFHRKDVIGNYSWKQVRAYVETNSEILPVNPEIVSKAGKVRAEEVKQKPDFGLADAIILATAREHGLKLLTGDPHLTSKEEAVELEKNMT